MDGENTMDLSRREFFKAVGQEERKIRKDPAARVTDLLKEVFAK